MPPASPTHDPRSDDRAIVVGISVYPGGFPTLHGPVLDAQDFHAWLISPEGGGMTHPGQARLITTPAPPPSDRRSARPVVFEIQEAFDDLVELARQNSDAGRGLRAGRRLYLYFSGHGFSSASVARRFETALLMANADRLRLGHHIPGRGYADWYQTSGYFDEILLFMDCCRDAYQTMAVAGTHFADSPAGNRQVRAFYAFGTKWRGRARERLFPEIGQTRGVFTRALMSGLWGAASDPLTGNVTTKTLRDYLFANMRCFLDPADMAAPDIPKEPDFDSMPEVDGEFVIVSHPPRPAELGVTFSTPVDRVNLLNPEFQEIDPVPNGPAPSVTFQVTPGRYRVQYWSGNSVVNSRIVVLEPGGRLHV